MFHEFSVETDVEDVNKQLDGCHYIDAKLMHYETDGAKVKMVWDKERPVGFMVYHLIYDCVLVVRAIYIKKQYRMKSFMRTLVLSPSKDIKRVFSKTLIDKEPNEIKGEKPKRKRIFQDDTSIVWEKVIGEA